MLLNSLQPMMAWAEDRATVRTDPSADPGAKIGGGAAARRNVSIVLRQLPVEFSVARFE